MTGKNEVLQHLDFESVTRQKGGYYSPMFVAEVIPSGKEVGVGYLPSRVVVKQYGRAPDNNDDISSFFSEEIDVVMRDVVELKQVVASSGLVGVPEMLFYTSVPEQLYYHQAIGLLGEGELGKLSSQTGQYRILIIEEYAGDSLRDLIRSGEMSADEIVHVIGLARKALLNIPKGVPIDSHPGNFTWSGSDLSYVDFMPPKIWEYRDNPRFVETFPTIKKVAEDELKRKRYLDPDGRVERFNYYLESLLQRV